MASSNTRTIRCWGDRRFEFDPRTTALLVIDMQRDFLDPEGMAAREGEDITPLRSVRPIVAAVRDICRAAELPIIHTREGYAPDMADVPASKADRGSVGAPGPLGRALIRGEPGHDFLEGFRPPPSEAVFDKPGFSGFYRTDLEQHLRDAGITHLMLAGITTQCCVHSTLRDAVDRGFYCLTVADACAAFDPAVHDAVFTVIQAEDHLFGWVAETRDIIAALA